MISSLYIPVISNCTEMYIKTMFAKHNIGKVSRVDFVKNLVKNRREAFVHFEEWFTTPEATKLQSEIMNPTIRAQFKYCESGKYWPLLVNKNESRYVVNANYENLSTKEVKTGYKVSLTNYCSNTVLNKEHGNKKRHILETQPTHMICA